MTTGIYAIENIQSRAVYIGATKRGFLYRWKCHLSLLSLGRHHNKGLQLDWTAVGAGWFKFVPVEVLPAHTLMAPYEQQWMDQLRGMNIVCYNRVPATEVPFVRKRRHRGPPIPEVLGYHVMTIHDVAERLQMTDATIRKLIHTYQLEAVVVGRHFRVESTAFDRFCEAHQTVNETSLARRV